MGSNRARSLWVNAARFRGFALCSSAPSERYALRLTRSPSPVPQAPIKA